MSYAQMLRHYSAEEVLAAIWAEVAPPQDPWFWSSVTQQLPVVVVRRG